MPRFSAESLSKLATCHIDLQTLFFQVIQTFDCIIIEGHRGEAEQNKDFAEHKSELCYPKGNHNAIPSHAVDVMPMPLDWNNTVHINFFAGYVLGIAQKLKDESKMTHSIRWGGQWMRNLSEIPQKGFQDIDHYEIVP